MRRNTTNDTQGIPPRYLIGAGVLIAAAFAYYWFSGAERREAAKYADVPAEEMTRMLLDGEVLPPTLTVQVEGLLDKRGGMYLFEYMQTTDADGKAYKVNTGDIQSVRVFGLLFPTGTELLDHEFLLRNHAYALRDVLGPSGRISHRSRGWNRAVDAQDALFSVYSGACGDEALLVEIDEGRHEKLYERITELARREIEAERTGNYSLVEAGSLVVHSLLAEQDYFVSGAFDVRQIEHQAEVAAELAKSELTPGVRFPATVALF